MINSDDLAAHFAADLVDEGPDEMDHESPESSPDAIEGEDLTTIDQAELSARLHVARDCVDVWARHVADLALSGERELEPFALPSYAAAKGAHAVLVAENSRRCDEYRRLGLI